MLRSMLCLGLLLCAPASLCASSAPACTHLQTPDAASSPKPLLPSAPTLTLGPDFLTFPEIAQKLSTKEHRVTCAPALQHYAAFVYLKERSWDQICRLLASGMQVQFRDPQKASADRVMEWDPSVRQRERAWMIRFAGNMQQYLQSRMNANAAYLSLPPAALMQRHDSLHAEMDAVQKQEPFDALRYQRLEAEALDISAAYQAASGDVKTRLILTLAQNSVPSVADMQEMIRTGHVFHLAALAQIPDALFAPVQAKYYASNHLHWDYLASGWELSSLETLAVQPCVTMLAVKGGESSLSEPVPAYSLHTGLTPLQQIFRGSSEDEAHRFAGLGKAATAWLEAEQKQTQEALADPRVKTDLPFVPQRASGEQSRLVAEWSKRQDAEAIMTLWPQREGEALSHLHNLSTALPSLFETTGPFALHLREGVLCVQNLLAFVDRERTLPVAALVQYARPFLPAQREGGADTPVASRVPLPDTALELDKLLAYCKAAVEASSPLLGHPCNVKSYHGVDTLNLDTGVGALFLWERLKVGERAKLLKQARQAYEAAYAPPVLEGVAVGGLRADVHSSMAARAAMQLVPLSRFDTRDLEKLTRIMQNWGQQYLYPYLPEFPQQLSASQLTVSVTPQGAKRPCIVWLDLKGPTGAEEALWGCRLNFLWQDK